MDDERAQIRGRAAGRQSKNRDPEEQPATIVMPLPTLPDRAAHNTATAITKMMTVTTFCWIQLVIPLVPKPAVIKVCICVSSPHGRAQAHPVHA